MKTLTSNSTRELNEVLGDLSPATTIVVTLALEDASSEIDDQRVALGQVELVMYLYGFVQGLHVFVMEMRKGRTTDVDTDDSRLCCLQHRE